MDDGISPLLWRKSRHDYTTERPNSPSRLSRLARVPMLPKVDTKTILQMRGQRSMVDPSTAPATVTEIERDAYGVPKQATTVFLIGKECPFRCLMCDLWKNTVAEPPPAGSLVTQLEAILPQITHREIIKLYNASNFFDPQVVPTAERTELGRLVRDFELVVVENHPKLVSGQVVDFAAQLGGQLQVAMGLETADAMILAWLNKQMSLSDYKSACTFLLEHKISIRTFLLLPAPGVEADKMVEHTLASVHQTLQCGSEVTSLIPLRTGNGVMDWLIEQRHVQLPELDAVVETFRTSLQISRQTEQRIFLDLWNLDTLADEGVDAASVCSQLERWNLNQAIDP